MVKVKCVKGFTLSGVFYEADQQYEMPAAVATDYAEYFEKMKAPPKNKAKKTKENK
tara:strand:+ start:534 stop:701 length:168 start_codon:yes stop_codon:yes gene_type:complete